MTTTTQAPTTAERIVAGDQFSEIFGITQTQLQGIAALGYNLCRQGKLKEAETVFRGLTATDSKCPYGFAGLGAVALAKKPADLSGAYENLSKAAELSPNDPTIQANLGEVFLRQAKLEEASKHFKRALELDPHQSDPGANRARAIISGLSTVVAELQRIQSAA